LNENDVVSTIIREGIKNLDDFIRISEEQPDDHSLDVHHHHQNVIGTDHVSLGSPQAARTLQYVETEFFGMGNKRAFKDFRKELSKALSMICNKLVRLKATDEVSFLYVQLSL